MSKIRSNLVNYETTNINTIKKIDFEIVSNILEQLKIKSTEESEP